MNKITIELLEDQNLDLNNLDNNKKIIIECFESFSLLKHSQLEAANQYLGQALIELIKNESIADFMFYLATGAIREIQISYCLFHNMLDYRNTSNDSQIYENGILNLEELESRIEECCPFEFATLIFNSYNKDYTNPGDNSAKIFLSTLYKFGGLSHSFLESFFEPHFQDFLKLLFGAVEAINNDDFNAFKDSICSKFIPLNTLDSIESYEDFNKRFEEYKDDFFVLLKFLLENFEKLRLCTIAVLESELSLELLTKSLQLTNAGKIKNDALIIFNNQISKIVINNPGKLNNDIIRQFKNYLEQDFKSTKSTGGFVNVLKRQTELTTQLTNGNYPFNYNIHEDETPIKYLDHFVENTEDLRTMNRLNFILENSSLVKSDEYELLMDKISKLLTSNSSNYISDIFELYFFTLMKVNKVAVKLLPSQKKYNQEQSTCDYKFGQHIGSDAKFLNGYNIEITKVSEHLAKVGSQIKSSLNYSDIKYGGAVIGVRDKQFNCFNALREYNGKDRSNLIERIPLINFIIELNSELRRHATKNTEKVKFILFYYIPEVEKPTISKRINQTINAQEQNEIFFIISTKYSSTKEIEEIKAVFKPVANFLFNFNNTFYESN